MIRRKKEPFTLYLPGRPQWHSSSGTIVKVDGDDVYIVINDGSINRVEVEILVQLRDGRQYNCQIVGQHPDTDIALLKIRAAGRSAFEFGDSDALQVGEEVALVGNPGNLPFSFITSTVSAKARSMVLDTEGAKMPVTAFIQIGGNPTSGFAGGPVVNRQGQLVGVVSPVTFPGIARFAIPVAIVERVTDDLIKHGTVHREFLGVCVVNRHSTKLAPSPGSPEQGVLIKKVWKDSAAEKAGLRRGDLITAINGEGVENTAQFLEKTFINADGPVEITYYRGGQQHVVNVQPQRPTKKKWSVFS
ncbi:MAG: trypsin-like peptidase domain-containing protein [Roseivirga sp.]